MNESKILEEELTSFTHDLFLDNSFIDWRIGLIDITDGKWRSLIKNLSLHSAPIKDLKKFDENIYSKLVFNCVKAPDFISSKEVMIVFTISGSFWHSLIWHCPENN